MKNMKKLLALMLALAMLMAMTACGSSAKGRTSEDIEPGSMNSGAYENSFFGIGCKLDGSWTCLSDEEILEMNGLAADSVDDDDLAGRLRDSGSLYDMSAMDEDGMISVNVSIENIGLLFGTILDTGGYVDAVLKSLENQLAATGMNVISCKKISLDFCGKRTDGIAVTSTMTVEGADVVVYQRQAYVKSGTYMFCATAATFFEDTTEDVLALFYEL